jgi:hypothetical protein
MGKFQHNNIFSLGHKKSNKKNKQPNAADPGSPDISQGVNIEEQK